MSRTRMRQREPIRPKPVQKIELSEKHLKLRTVLTVLLLLIGATAIALGVSALFGGEAGWTEIEAAPSEASVSQDFTFLYYLGGSEASPSEEKRGASLVYTDAVQQAYRLFTNDVEYEDVHNIRTVNLHPNEEIEVDEALYRAFSQIRDSGDRSLYLAPVYTRYDDLFACSDDSQTVDFDPYKNPELAAEYAEIARYANDKDAVDLELLEGNKVRLKVSEEYLAYAEENRIVSFIDFFWMKNAFVADYLADRLASAGYTRGCLTSFDGFVRNLDDSGDAYSLAVQDRVDNTLYPAGTAQYTGPMSVVYFRNYGLSDQDSAHYYRYEDGTVRTSYLDARDGLCKSARNDLICFSRELTCAEVLLKTIPLYIADSFQEDAALALPDAGIHLLYCEDSAILCSDPTLTVTNLYDDCSVRYRQKALQ